MSIRILDVEYDINIKTLDLMRLGLKSLPTDFGRLWNESSYQEIK